MTLIGPDFPPAGSVPDADYQRATRDRVLAADVRGGLCFTGRLTRDEVREVLPTIGVGLSTSRRESFHLGAAELMGSGSVPVIRDWPMYAGMSGAASVFPAEAVVSTVDEAVARIAALAAEDRWDERGAEARAWIARRYSPGEVGARLKAALLGA
jgi:glycosyltransferase involved in cell wall biosynthesis